MATLYTHKAANISKTWFLLALFSGLVIAVGYVLSIVFDNTGIMMIAGLGAIGTSMYSYWFSDKVVLKMTNARQIERKDAKELYEIIDNLAIAAGLPTPKIFIMEDSALNAFATGRNPEHGVIVFTTGILQALDKEELRGVAAHELSHIGNRDMLVSTIAVIFSSALAMIGRLMFWGGGRGMGGNRQGGGAVTVVIAVGLLVLAPFLATLLRMAVSRKREYLADASGAMLTRYPEGLASALEKIGGDHRSTKHASNATAHLFIANPFKGKSVMKFFMTHPPIEDRVARLRGADIDAAIRKNT